jgi:ribosomal protein S14
MPESSEVSNASNASKVEARKKERSCNSCGEKKEIVFERGDFGLCKECLDDFMREHRLGK